MPVTPRFLHGIHDPGGEELMETRPGWVVFTRVIGGNESFDFSPWSDRGFGVIVRLNHGYGADGTIPTPNEYAAFADMCGAWVAASDGCTRWIIGNEPNHEQERPQGQTITPAMYADCFRRVARAVIALAGSGHELIPAAVAPWNVQSGDWLDYFREMLIGCQDYADGIALHTYTHGASPELITSAVTMDAPYADRNFNFRAYRDFLNAVPTAMRQLPVFITETNQIDPWADVNNGWVQAAYHEIDAWNQQPGTQKVHCLALYRWSRDDHWSIQDKPNVLAAFKQAVGLGYRVPVAETVQAAQVHQTFIPVIHGNDTMPNEELPARDIDPRLVTRGVTVADAAMTPGAEVWRLVEAQWYDEQAAGGRHHIYVEAVDADGVDIVGASFVVTWPTGFESVQTNGRRGFDAANYPMSPSRNEYAVRMTGDLPSDTVQGIGRGADTPSGFNPGIHTSTRVRFVRVRSGASVTQPVPTPPTAEPHPEGSRPQPEPPVETHLPGGIIDPRVAEAVMQVESGNAGFNADGSLKIRVEAHLLLNPAYGNPAAMAQRFRFEPGDYYRGWLLVGDQWVEYHALGQAGEWQAFTEATALDRAAALRCTSMGASQVMGFHFAKIGYASVGDMFAAFSRSANVHALAFGNYCLATPGLVAAINARDWATIGKLYNGAANAGEKYRAAYQELWGVN